MVELPLDVIGKRAVVLESLAVQLNVDGISPTCLNFAIGRESEEKEKSDAEDDIQPDRR